VEACTIPALDVVAAFAAPDPDYPSQSRRFFRVWPPSGSPRPADHSAYFGRRAFPLRRCETVCRLPPPGCPGCGCLSWSSLPLGALYATGVTRTHRVASLPPWTRISAGAVRSLLQPPSAASFESASFSRELDVSFRVRATYDLPLETSKQPCDHPEAKERLPWGFVPLRGISWRRPLPAGAPSSDLTLRPWRSSRLRRFTPPPALRVCFTPQPRPGFALQGIVPLRGAFDGFPHQVPSCPLDRPACGCPRQHAGPGLQGLRLPAKSAVLSASG